MLVTDFMIKDALRYMQMPKEKCDEELIQKIKHTYEALSKTTYPKYAYSCFDVSHDNNQIFLKDTKLKFVSSDMVKLLEHCERCYMLAVTLGQDVDKEITKKQKTDMLGALILDACASVLVDKVCDDVEGELAKGLKKNEYLTMRFSPGYGDVSLEVQQDLLDVLGAAKKIGLTLTKTNMLIPVKSVTAFIGISSQKEDRQKSCKRCSQFHTCLYRERGDRCGI